MKFESIEVIGCKRFMTNRIERLVIDLSSKEHIILGSNGAGKSSLLNLLSVLPPNPKAFKPGGSWKVVACTSLGERYQLQASFQDKPTYSFIELSSGKELNTGRNAATQKDLADHIFGITSDKQALVTGREKFSKMRAARRREVFTLMCPADYTYATKVYNKAKERWRDLTGALKMAQKRLTLEKAKVQTQESLNLLADQVKEIKATMDYLVEQRVKSNVNPSLLKAAATRIEQSMLELAKKVSSVKLPKDLKSQYDDTDHVQLHISAIEREITAASAVIDQSHADHNELLEVANALKSSGANGVASIEVKIEQLTKEKEDLNKLKSSGALVFEDCTGADQALKAIASQLDAIFLTLPDNKDRYFTQAQGNQLKSQLAANIQAITDLSNELGRLQAQIKHLESHKLSGKLTCPKCSHIWHQGFDQVKLEATIEELGTKSAELAALRKDKELLELQMGIWREYVDNYRQYMLLANTEVLRPLWERIAEQQLVFENPKAVASLVAVTLKDLEIDKLCLRIDQEIAEQKSLITTAQKAGNAGYDALISRLGSIEEVIENKTQEMYAWRVKLQGATHTHTQLNIANLAAQSLLKLSGEYERNLKEMIDAIKNDVINDSLRKLAVDMAIKEGALNEMVHHAGIVQDIEYQIDTLTLEVQAAKAVMDALSPVDGLIAQGLLGFIRAFVAQMNQEISKIFTYDLQVLDCSGSLEEDLELDYKFPVQLSKDHELIEDIEHCSVGQREVIDLAFQIVCCVQLGLSQYPLFIDEFGANLDHTHQLAATQSIRDLMDSRLFSQLFMISHYESSYGAFTNAMNCVLCEANIVTPRVYNQHVILE